eukprot:TRINITY_DN30979_c0_g1_i1.p1 TRINITY_DN30979_c0_g1~~TRINITY_DN30979_c0_g1_i1.p1  ORF type:complete len:251 (+),score=83.08 TRINITY_DN30979_c0_g1_i1:85-753(+)
MHAGRRPAPSPVLPLLAAAAAALPVAAADADKVDERHVTVLTDSNFEELTQAASGGAAGDWFVEFYAPWCGWCRRLRPEWAKLALDLRGAVRVGKVDVTANTALARRFRIHSFPTLKLFSQGTVYSYEGDRTAAEMAAFARGGFKSAPESARVPVPGIPGALDWLRDLQVTLGADLATLLAEKRAATAVVFALGWVCCFAAVQLLGGPRGAAPAPPPKHKGH